MLPNINERLLVLFPDIKFAPDLMSGDCVLDEGEIWQWGRSEPQPLREELLAVTQDRIDEVKAG